MRSILWMSLLSISLAAGGCKKTQDDPPGPAQQKTAEGANDPGEADLTAAKDTFSRQTKDRLQRFDIRLGDLANKSDPRAQDDVSKLKKRRDHLASELRTIPQRTAADWKAFTQDVDERFDALENDLNRALE